MTIQRMDHVGIVVDDLAAAIEFFVELGLEVQGKGSVEGGWVDRIVGLEGVKVDFAMLQTPDGHGRLELVKFHSPSIQGGDRARRRTRRASATSHSSSTTSTPSSPACEPAAPSSSASWCATRTASGSATSAAPRGSSSSWRRRSDDLRDLMVGEQNPHEYTASLGVFSDTIPLRELVVTLGPRLGDTTVANRSRSANLTARSESKPAGSSRATVGARGHSRFRSRNWWRSPRNIERRSKLSGQCSSGVSSAASSAARMRKAASCSSQRCFADSQTLNSRSFSTSKQYETRSSSRT